TEIDTLSLHDALPISVASNSLNDGVADLLIRPIAEPGFFILGDIRAVNFSERNRKSASPCVEDFPGHCVASAAAGQRKDILTSLDKITTVLLGPSIDRIK